MIGKSVDSSDLLTRKKREILVAVQQSKGPYVQLENKSMGFGNGLLQILGSRGLNTYSPPLPTGCIGTYNPFGVAANALGLLTITSSGWTTVNTPASLGYSNPSFPPYSIYSGMNIQFPSPSATYFIILINCSGSRLYWSTDNGASNVSLQADSYVFVGAAFPSGILVTSS